MADGDGAGAPYVWTSAETVKDGEPETAAFVKAPGRAKVVYPNGDTFEGAFNDAKEKHGPGKYVWSTEVGEEGPKNAWVPLNEEGTGSALPEGRVVAFEGEYVEGRKEGIGSLRYPNGDRYHGMWKTDKPEGDGTYYYANGDLYSGQWRGGKKHGRGAFVFKSDDSQLVGTWREGQLVTGKWVLKDGTSWHGSFKGGRPFGRGVFYFPNGNMQEGEYVEEGTGEDDDPEAVKKLVWRGGSVRVGTAPASDLLAPPVAPPAGHAEESKD